MKKLKMFLAVVAIACMVGGIDVPISTRAAAVPSPAATTSLDGPSWPRAVERNGNHILVYQPQLKSWQRYRTLTADTAISITPSAGGKQILGVISWRANTPAHLSLRTVYVSNTEVISSRFSSVDRQQEAELQKKVQQIYPTLTFNISIERMIASLNHGNAPVQSIPGIPEVPPILVNQTPAIVLTVDGKPILTPIEGSTLQYVVNANWDVIYDRTDYFLLLGKTWPKTKDLAGPSRATTKLPGGMSTLPKTPRSDVLNSVAQGYECKKDLVNSCRN
jgi:hypothetical protein